MSLSEMTSQNETHGDIAASSISETSSLLTSGYLLWMVIDCVLFIIIISGNVLTILAIQLSRRLRNVTAYFFVLSLAISDFLVGLTLPYHLAFYIDEELGTFKLTCILRFALISLACCASIFSLIAIAVDRYIAIVHPLKYTKYMTRKTALGIVLIGWTMAIIISAIPLFWNCFDTAKECEMDTILPRYYTVAILSPMLCLIWVAMFLLYWKIWREASTHARRLRDKSFINEGPSDWKSVQVVLLVLGCFSTCWLPYVVVAIFRVYGWRTTASNTLYRAMFFLAIANSGMNPLIYAWKNSNFRNAFNKLLHFHSPNHHDFNSSLKRYLHRQKQLVINEVEEENAKKQDEENSGLKTICDNTTFKNGETPDVMPV